MRLAWKDPLSISRHARIAAPGRLRLTPSSRFRIHLSSSLETRRDAVDDGTGCLECVVWLNSAGDDGGATLTAGGGAVSNGDFSIDLRGLRLGALVRCQGRVAEYREKLQLKVDAVQRCDDANAEPLFWLDHARCVANIHAERAGDAGERGVSRDKPREGD
jgi:hypothetical protein